MGDIGQRAPASFAMTTCATSDCKRPGGCLKHHVLAAGQFGIVGGKIDHGSVTQDSCLVVHHRTMPRRTTGYRGFRGPEHLPEDVAETLKLQNDICGLLPREIGQVAIVADAVVAVTADAVNGKGKTRPPIAGMGFGRARHDRHQDPEDHPGCNNREPIWAQITHRTSAFDS